MTSQPDSLRLLVHISSACYPAGMAKKPTHAPCGGRVRPDGGWKKYIAEVMEHDRAAQRAAPKHKPTEAALANLRPGRMRLVDKAPRCVAMARSTGQPCKAARVLGSTLCAMHGGLLEVPSHPGSRREWGGARGERLQAAIDARIAMAGYPKAIRDAVHAAYRAAEGAKRRRRDKWPTLLAGAQALTADPSGKAFRRWLADLHQAVSAENKTHNMVGG